MHFSDGKVLKAEVTLANNDVVDLRKCLTDVTA